MKEKISITLDSKIIRNIKAMVDGIKIRNKSQAIEFLLRKSLPEKRVVVILAGGPEERLKINGTFKLLVKVGNKSVIERAIENLRKYKFTDIFIVGRKNVLSECFKQIGDGSEYGVNLQFIEEKGEKPITPSDTARTLKLLKDRIKSSFLCLYCDIIFNYDLNGLWNFHLKNDNIITLLLKTTEEPIKWGVVSLNGNKIIKFIEKPKKAESYLVYTGIFVSEPEIFSQIGDSLEHEIFPQLAERGLLSGYVCLGKSEHIHKIKIKLV